MARCFEFRSVNSKFSLARGSESALVENYTGYCSPNNRGPSSEFRYRGDAPLTRKIGWPSAAARHLHSVIEGVVIDQSRTLQRPFIFSFSYLHTAHFTGGPIGAAFKRGADETAGSCLPNLFWLSHVFKTHTQAPSARRSVYRIGDER